MSAKPESYVTPELMTELNGILEEEAEDKALFDDFSQELLESTPITVNAEKVFVESGVEREAYLKERRRCPNVALPESVEG